MVLGQQIADDLDTRRRVGGATEITREQDRSGLTRVVGWSRMDVP
ncbi:MAG: hypothetical protein AAGD38_18575 [Acidobacteriota bacterium]